MLNFAYHLKRVNAFRAWQHTKGSPLVKLAVVDTGLDPSALTTGTGDLLPPDYQFNPLTGGDARDEVLLGGGDVYSHGTSVWSAIKAAHDGRGTAGICPGVYGIFIAKQSYDVVDGTILDSAAAVRAAVNAGARIINLSWFTWNNTKEIDAEMAGAPIFEAVSYALQSGCLVFVSAGNENDQYDAPNHSATPGFNSPCDIDGVILVSGAGGPAPHPYDSPWNGNDAEGLTGVDVGPSWGAGIDFVAPAADMFLTMNAWDGPGPNYGFGGWEDGLIVKNGAAYPGGPVLSHHQSTSFASPLVAGVAALVLSVNPALTNAEVLSILRQASVAGNHRDWATRYPNAGMIDAGKAVVIAKSTLPENAATIFPYLGASGLGVDTQVVGEVATSTLGGDVYLDITGFSSTAIVEVELWLRDTLVYSGPPARVRANASSSGPDLSPLRVVAKTATGQAEETFADLVTTDIAIPASLTVTSDTGTAGEVVWVSPDEFYVDVDTSTSSTFTVSSGTSAASVTVGVPITTVVGVASGQASASANLTQRRSLAGSAGGKASAIGGASVNGPSVTISPSTVLTATAADGETVSFGVSEWTLEAVDGTSIGVAISPTGYYGPGVEFTGSAAGHAGATAAPSVLQSSASLSGIAAGHSDASSFFEDIYPSGVVSGKGGATGTLSQDLPLSGIAEGHSDAGAIDLSKMSLFETLATCESLTDVFKPRRVAASAANLRSKVGPTAIRLAAVGSVDPPTRPSRPTNTRATRGDS